MSQMHVEFVSPHRHRLQTGIGRYVHTMAHHLSAAVDVTICEPRFLPMANRFSSLRNLPIGIESHVPGSVVHFPQIMGCAMLLYQPYHPSVATVHDLGALELPEEWEMFDPVGRQMLRLSLAGLKRVDRIVAISEFTRQGLIEHLGISADRVVTIHLGIDHDLFRPIPGARQELAARYPQLAAIETDPWLLYVGSELPRKNVGLLLKAMALVHQDIPDIRLIKVGLAGGEKYRQETLRHIHELGLEDNVLIFEGVAEQELPLFYGAADVFVTASKLEGFGFPVLEAMACGTPVVCSDAAALPEVAGTGVLYARWDDPGAMSDQIKRALVQERFDVSSRNAAIQHSASFRWDKCASSLVSLYQSIAT